MRARYPDQEGYVEREGVKIFYEVFGEGDNTILLLPTWSIIHSRFWKAQVPYLARHFRVITFDGRGNGRSDRPEGAEAYRDIEFARDALAVMDATNTGQAALVALSRGANWGVILAADFPERVSSLVITGGALPLPPNHLDRIEFSFNKPLATTEGWAKFNRHYWLENYKEFLEFFFGQAFSEPHSTKQIEDAVGWGLETSPETLIATVEASYTLNEQTLLEYAGRIRCPVLLIHGTDDKIIPYDRSVNFAGMTGASLVLLEGSGHIPYARDPVK